LASTTIINGFVCKSTTSWLQMTSCSMAQPFLEIPKMQQWQQMILCVA
jgi:hypothetical protein